MSMENITEEMEQEEKYVPKAVLFQQSSGGQKLKEEIKKADAEEDAIKQRIKKVNGFAASLFKTKLFNFASLLYIGNSAGGFVFYASFLVLMMLLGNTFGGFAKSTEINYSIVILIVAAILCFVLRTIAGFMTFIGMRTLVDSARKYETRVSSEGATTMIVAAGIRFVVGIVFAVSIVFVPKMILSNAILAAVYLVTDTVNRMSIRRVRAAIVEGETKKLPFAAVILCVVHAILNVCVIVAVSIIPEFQMNYGVWLWVIKAFMAVAAVSLILMSIFIVYYNGKIKKFNSENNLSQ